MATPGARRPIPLLSRLSLRAKVMGLLLVLSLGPLILAGAVTVHRAAARGKDAERTNYNQAVQAAAQRFETQASRSLITADVLARHFPTNRADPSSLRRALTAPGQATAVWQAAGLVHEFNDAGVTAVLAAPDGKVLSTTPYIHHPSGTIAPLLAPLPPHGGVITGRIAGVTRGESLVAIRPILREKRTAAWVALVTDEAELIELLQRATPDLHGTVGLFDAEGRPVVTVQTQASDTQAVRQQWLNSDTSIAQEVEIDGTGWLVARAQVPDTRLSIQARAPLDGAYRDIYILNWILIGIIVLTFLLVLLFADYLASVLLRPIRALRQGAEMIGSGALHHRIQVEGHQHDELGRLANTFNQMAEGLERSERKVRAYSRSLETANAEREALVHGLSNDLKRSAQTVQAFATFLEENHTDALGEDGARLVHGVLTNIDRVERFSDDIVRLLEQERSRGEASRFSLEKLLTEVRERVALQHPDGEIVFVAPLPELHADRAQIAMLFDNLIVNGLKYNRAARPRVEVSVADDVLDWQITVRDNGIGIDPAAREAVFELFHRLHRQAEFPGTGTGLTLARRVVEDHRGTIRIDTNPEGGTDIVVGLPKRPQLLTLPGVRPPND